MIAKFLRLVLDVEAVIYLLLHNLHDCTFKSGICIICYISINHYYSKRELWFNEEAMEKYK